MKHLLQHVIDVAKGKIPANLPRSSKWTTVREHFLKEHSACAICGSVNNIQVHHKRPFHLHPELELDTRNLITLCESGQYGVNCHLFFGHLGNFKSWNVDIDNDAMKFNAALKNRPAQEGAK